MGEIIIVFNKNSIKNKIIITTLFLITIPFILSTVINSYYLSKDYKEQLKDINQQAAYNISNQVTTFIEKAYSMTESVALDSDVKLFDTERQISKVKTIAESNDYFDLVYIQDSKGMQTARSKGDLGDRSNRWWFKQMTETKKPFVSQSYYSISGNVPVTSVFLPIESNGNMVGIMGGDIKLEALQKLVENSSTGNRYAYILDSEGVIIAHPDKTKVSELYNYKKLTKTVLKLDSNSEVVKDEKGNPITVEENIEIPESLKTITEKVLNGEEGFSEFVDENGNKAITAYNPIKIPGDSKNWAVISVEDDKSSPP